MSAPKTGMPCFELSDCRRLVLLRSWEVHQCDFADIMTRSKKIQSQRGLVSGCSSCIDSKCFSPLERSMQRFFFNFSVTGTASQFLSTVPSPMCTTLMKRVEVRTFSSGGWPLDFYSSLLSVHQAFRQTFGIFLTIQQAVNGRNSQSRIASKSSDMHITIKSQPASYVWVQALVLVHKYADASLS